VGVEDSEGAARAILAKLAPSPSPTAPLPSRRSRQASPSMALTRKKRRR